MRESNVIVIFTICCYFLILPGCTPSKQESAYVIGFSQCTGGDAWRERMLFQMNRELTFHPELRMEYRDAEGNNEKQVTQIEELLALGVDVLIVSPNEAEPLAAVINKAYTAGIPVILVDRKTGNQNFTSFLGADNVDVGRLAGNRAVALTQASDRILEITGLIGSTPAQDRHRGFVEELDAPDEKRRLIVLNGDWTPAGAKKALALNRDSLVDIQLVFAHNDPMALAAKQYFDSLGQEVEVIGVDGLPQLGMELVISGQLVSTVLYPTGGAEAIKLAADVLQGKRVAKQNELVITLIDQRNAAILQQQAYKIIEQMELIWSFQEVVSAQEAHAIMQERWLYSVGAFSILLIIGGVVVIRSNRQLKIQKALTEEQRAHVEKLNAHKDKFFRILAHDLRNPLASLKGFSNVLVNDYDRVSKEEIMALAQGLEASVGNALTMTDNITDWAKVQMNNINHTPEAIPLREHAVTCADIYQRAADAKNIEIKLAIDPQISVRADRNQFDFILRNLINNAIKFTLNGGEVIISSSELTNNQVCISVRDTGVGIPREVLPTLFDSTKKRSTKGTNDEQGTGLGLVLCREFVRMNEGTIHVDSLPGKGSTFRIFLPKA